ncbi:Ca2-binding protein [Aureococcus anophagefferens]|nr:Ca2-binding protein [Aureococcus anophagefferens]
MVRRFRDDRGRVQYRGPLLSLLEAPNLKALEAQLIRVLTKAEAKGTTLERAFAYFDQDHGGTISVRFDENGDGVISLDEFLAFVRQRQREYKERKGLLERKPVANEAALLEARVKAIFLKAEELGVSVVDAFNEFDADGNGQLTVGEFGDALRSLGTFSDLKPREVKAFFDHRDRGGNGTLELEELFALMGRDYADHLVLKLSRILDGVERKGTMIADCFAAWDADGGLEPRRADPGPPEPGHLQPHEAPGRGEAFGQARRRQVGRHRHQGVLPLREADYGAFVEARSGAQRRRGEARRAPGRGVPRVGQGRRPVHLLDELRRGLDELGVFKGVDEGDIKKLLKKLDDDDSGEINMAEFLGFAGCDYSAVLARRLRAILLNAEERGTTLEAAFAEWDKDGGGTIDHAELKAGLKALGTFADMSGDGRDDQADVDKLVRYFDRDGDGSISVRELLRFMGRDPISSIEAKLRQIVHASGIGADEAFKHFDKDGDGSITRDELAEGLRELPGLEDITNAEAAALAKLYDANGDDEIQLDEFTRQLGASAAVGDAERLRRASRAGVVDDAALERAFADVGVEGAVDAATRKLLLGRFDAGGGASVGALVKFAKRGGVGTPDEIARDLGEPSASPTEASTRPPDAAAALEDPACAKLAELLLTFEASGADLAVAFKKLDPDGSGDIEAVELFEGLRGLGDAFADLTLADARRVVKALDADRSNSIDLTELRAFALAARNAKDEPDEDPKSPTGDGAQDKVGDLFLAFQDGGGDLRDAFARLDADGSGSIDAGELYEGLKGLGPVFDDLTRDDAKRLVRVIDTDGNGGVELREIEDFAREFRAKKTGGRPAAEKRGDRIDETAKTLRAVLAKAARSGAKLKDAFAAFDRDGSGKLSARELHKALKHVGGDDLFRDVTRKDVEALVRREFDDDGDAEVDIGEFVAFATKPIDDAPRTPGGRRESAELVREKLRAILLRTEQMGTSLKSVFRALDDDGSGALSVKELLRGLRKLGVFQELDADDVEKLVRSDLDRDGNDAVELDEFLAFCRDAPGPAGTLDPDTRCVEKKLRRAARELAGRGGDVRLLLDQYDVEGVGSVIRSDFVQVLMQLGLSLVDGGGPPRGDVDDAPTRADALRERQLAQLARVRGGGPGPANARRLLRTRQSRGDDDDARLVDEWDDLKMVEWYREGSKRDMVRGMLAKSMLVTVPIYPTFGTTAWFEVEIHNPFSRAERFTVDIAAKERELRLVTSSEWAHLRRHVPVAFGARARAPSRRT